MAWFKILLTERMSLHDLDGMEYKYMCGGSSQYFSFDMFLGHWDLFKKGQNKTVIVPMPGIMLITYLCTLLLRKPRALLRVVSTQCNANEIVGRKWKGFPVICSLLQLFSSNRHIKGKWILPAKWEKTAYLWAMSPALCQCIMAERLFLCITIWWCL